jgi:hypothetical protein
VDNGGICCLELKPSNLPKINHELDDLQTSNPLLPPDPDSSRALEVIPVHNNVYHEVESNGNP